MARPKKGPTKVHTLPIRLDEKTRDRLRSVAEVLDRTPTDLVREGISEALFRYEGLAEGSREVRLDLRVHPRGTPEVLRVADRVGLVVAPGVTLIFEDEEALRSWLEQVREKVPAPVETPQ